MNVGIARGAYPLAWTCAACFGLFFSGPASADILVGQGSLWSYDDTGTDLGTAWRDPPYDDSGWASGLAQLGYGDGDEATVISFGPDPSNKFPTAYFRQNFNVVDPAVYASLEVRVVRDDGCVVYLNGTEVVRSNMPAGGITFNSLASATVGPGDEGTFNAFPVDPNLLVAGNNVVAVEVHQVSATSSDLSFDLELEGLPPIPSVTLASPLDQSVVNNTSVSFTCSATDAVGLVDATLYLGSDATTVLFSGPTDTDDAFLSADQPDTNFGSDLSLNVDGQTPHAHGVIKFPLLFGGGPGQVPLGSAILSATLEVNCTNFGALMQMYRLIEDWDEGQVTWNDRSAGVPWTSPGADGPYSHAGVPLPADCTATGLRSLDITQFVQEWSFGSPNYGIVLVDGGTDGLDFDSSESANPPVLTVTYQPDWQPVETKPLSGTSDTVTFTTTLNDKEDYLWNCLVTNTSGQQSYAPADFTLSVDTNVPDAPVLVTPADGATGEALSPLLEVTVSDPDGDPLDVTFYGRKASGAGDFTVIALPDTQRYSESFPQLYDAQTQWIVNSAVAMNIVFVTHEGDIVQNWDNTTEWDRADAAMSLLDGVVPYGMGPGNHDQPTTYFNIYFPYTRYELEVWYGGHYADKNDNNFELFSAGVEDFVVIHLEFCPPAAAITWADSVLKSYPNRKAIITTHGYIDTSGARSVSSCTDTQYIWDDLVVPNPNVHFLLCGHVSGEHYRVDNVNGHPVHQLLADYQNRPSGGEAWLRIMRFSPSDNKVYVETYSPWLDQYETDGNSQFAIDFPMNDFQVIATNDGVASGSNTSTVWSGLEASTAYEWYVTVTDSTGRMQTGPVWSFTTGGGDVTPPVISDVAAINITESAATITWNTDEPADSLVDYGLDTNYGSQEIDAALVTAHSIDLTGLDPDTTYHYQVTSEDSSGNPATSGDFTFVTLPDTTPPAPPAGLTAAPGDTTASLDWAESGEPDFASYSVYRSTTSGGPYSLVTSGLTQSLFQDTDLTNDTTYYWVVTAVDTSANESGNSNEASATPTDMTPPSAPVGLAATPGDGSVNLDWADNSEPDLASYSVYRSTTAGGPYSLTAAGLPSSAYIDTGLTNGTTYYYVVTATDTSTNESGFSAEAAATPFDGTPPAPPVGLVASAGDGQATLDWDDNTEPDLASYSVYRSTTSGAPYALVVSGVAASNFTDTGLTNGTTYYWVVTAVDTSANESGDSNEATATPTDMTPPAAPTGLSATPGDGEVTLDWDDNAESDLASYSVHRSVTPGGPYSEIATSLVTSDYTDTGLTNGTAYYYVVTAVDLAANESGYSTEASATPTDMTPPAAPQNLAAAAGDGVVDLTWDPNAEPDLDGYNVYRGTTPGSHPLKVNASVVTGTSYADTTVTNGTTYFYVVRAVDLAGNPSADSNEASATPTDATPPAAPVGLVATGGTAQVLLDWADNSEPDLAGYNVYRSLTSGGGFTQLNVSLVTSSDYSDTAVTNGVTYYYEVTAVDLSGNESPPSNEASATPLSQALAAGEPVFTVGIVLSGTYTDTHADDGVAEVWEEGALSRGRRSYDGYYVFDAGLDAGDITALDLAVNAWFDDADNDPAEAPTVYAQDFSANSWDALGITISATQDGTTYTASLDPSQHVSPTREIWIRFVDGVQVKGEAKDHLSIDFLAVDVSGNVDPPPAAPTGLAAMPGDATVALDWDDNTEGDLAGYNVYRSTTSGSGYSLVNGSIVVSSDYVDTGVLNGTTYYYVVRAVDIPGGESGDSNEAAATPADPTPPAPPAALDATAGDSIVDLTWAPNGEGDLAGYNVYRGTAPGSHPEKLNGSLISAGPTPSFTDTTAVNGTTYYYVVTAEDTSGNESGDSNEASATPVDGPPLPPTGLVATAGDGQVDLDWTPNAEPDIAGYNVFRSLTAGGPYTLLNTTGLVAANTFTDTDVTNGTTYYYVVTAEDTSGNESGNSSEASATPNVSDTLHVGDISMAVQPKGPNWEGQATVLVLDQGAVPVEAATVVGDWLYTPSGGAQEVLQSGATGLTNVTGEVLLKSPKVRASTGDVFTFRVTDLQLTGFTYDPAQNIETEDSIAVP